jgi:hypothetical protein
VSIRLIKNAEEKNRLIKNAEEKKYEEICRVANRDFGVRRIGSGKDELLPQLCTLPHLH